MGFTESVKTCLSKYIDFSGRASRPEYWWFFLFTFIAMVIAWTAKIWIPDIGRNVSLVLLPPLLWVMARRLNDANKTKWWMLLPIGGWIVGIIVAVIFIAIGLDSLWEIFPLLGVTVGFLVIAVPDTIQRPARQLLRPRP